MKFGPERQPLELLSSFRSRQAFFSLKLSFGAGVLLATLLIARPDVAESNFPYILMLIYIFVPLTFIAALVSTIVMGIGVLSAMWFESHPAAEAPLARFKNRCRYVFTVLAALFGTGCVLNGLINGRIPNLNKYAVHTVSFNDSPESFFVCFMVWSALTALVWKEVLTMKWSNSSA